MEIVKRLCIGVTITEKNSREPLEETKKKIDRLQEAKYTHEDIYLAGVKGLGYYLDKNKA